VAFAVKGYKGITRAGKPDFLLVYAVGLVMISATLVTTFEQGHSTALESFPESLLWSLVNITTVGYGDMVPASQIGRVVAVFLMLGGIGIFGAVTANLASVFSSTDDPNTKLIEELTKEIRELKSEMRNPVTS
jgi:voltage-gated potassium channel